MRMWFTMQKTIEEEKPVAEVMIYDVIGSSFFGEDTVSASGFVTALANLGDVEQIKLRINSPGGDVFDGVAIYNAIKNHKAKVTAHVDGLAASAASLIAMAADKIVMPSNAFMLVHNASGFAIGQAEDLRAVASDLDRVDKSMVATYVARSGSTEAKVRNLMKEDRLIDAKEAKEMGFTDEVSAPVKLAATYSLALLPPAAAERFRAVTGTGQGDPPQSVPAPEVPGGQPVAPPTPTAPAPSAPPAPTSPPAAEVIELNKAKQRGIEEHQAYVASVTDLCTLARVPERVGGYVRANVTVEQVRRELLDAQAHAAPVLPQHPLATGQPTASAWDKVTTNLNARNKQQK
jgi:ATP-dependent Clp protease protease subunit